MTQADQHPQADIHALGPLRLLQRAAAHLDRQAVARHGEGVRETFTVRKISFQVGVERTFPVHSPVVEKVELLTRGDVRRAKLYYLRDLRGKAAKIKEKRDAVPAKKA